MKIVEEFCKKHPQYSKKKLAQRWGISHQTFYNWCNNNKYENLLKDSLAGIEREINFNNRVHFEID